MGSGLPGQFGGRAGLTLARAEVLDGDVQALAAGDGPQLTLVTIGDAIRPADLGHKARLLGEPRPLRPPPHAPPLTFVALAPGQVGVGHTQCAEPASSTQEAPNSQRISAQVLGAEKSGAQTQETPLAQAWPPRDPVPSTGSPASARPGPHLSHSQQGPGHGRANTARTWPQPPQAYTSRARSSARSHPGRHPGGHSCRLRRRGGDLRSVPRVPTGPRAWPSPCQVWARPGPE